MTWEELIRSGMNIFPASPILRSIRYSKVAKDSPVYRKLLFYFKDDVGYYYENFEDHEIFGQYLMKKLMKDDKFWNKHCKEWMKEFKKLRNIVENARSLNLEKLPNIELANIGHKINAQTEYWHGIAYSVDAIDYIINKIIEDYLVKLLIKKYGKNLRKTLINQYYKILTTPEYLTYINQYEIAVLKLIKLLELKKIKISYKTLIASYKKSISVKRTINLFIKKYYWIDFKWGKSQEKGITEVINDILNMKKEHKNVNKRLQEINAMSSNNQKLKKNTLKEINADKTLKRYIWIFENYSKLHDLRKEGQVKSGYYLKKLLKIASKRFKVNENDLYYCWWYEIEGLLSTKKIDFKKINKRKLGVFVIIDQKSTKEYYGKAAFVLKEKLTGSDLDQKKSELQGITGCTGKATGKVKVVLSAKEAIKKIENGDILITGMTMPEFLPAMKKAAAIVTDEGGITCHAAIIAREFNIPCIVGTKYATRLLKDGMLVEVNANHSVVKILKNEKN